MTSLTLTLRNFFNGVDGSVRKMTWIGWNKHSLWAKFITIIHEVKGALDVTNLPVRSVADKKKDPSFALSFRRTPRGGGEFSVKYVRNYIDGILFPKDSVPTRCVKFKTNDNTLKAAGGGGAELSTSNWSKFPPQPQEFVVNSPSKVQLADMSGSQLHFANNARYWNPSAGGVNDIRPPFFPSLQMQLPSSTFEDKPKIAPKVVKESTSESSSSSTKRPRTENQSPLPAAFK
nr:transcription factor bHLH123-like isoform X2 [Tanacetum cinerariifolium]